MKVAAPWWAAFFSGNEQDLICEGAGSAAGAAMGSIENSAKMARLLNLRVWSLRSLARTDDPEALHTRLTRSRSDAWARPAVRATEPRIDSGTSIRMTVWKCPAAAITSGDGAASSRCVRARVRPRRRYWGSSGIRDPRLPLPRWWWARRRGSARLPSLAYG